MNYVKQADLSVKIDAFELIVLFVFWELKENDDHFLSSAIFEYRYLTVIDDKRFNDAALRIRLRLRLGIWLGIRLRITLGIGLGPRVSPSYFFYWYALKKFLDSVSGRSKKKIYMMLKSYFIIVFYIYKVKLSNIHVLFSKNH
jgi:hypothetical protein